MDFCRCEIRCYSLNWWRWSAKGCVFLNYSAQTPGSIFLSLLAAEIFPFLPMNIKIFHFFKSCCNCDCQSFREMSKICHFMCLHTDTGPTQQTQENRCRNLLYLLIQIITDVPLCFRSPDSLGLSCFSPPGFAGWPWDCHYSPITENCLALCFGFSLSHYDFIWHFCEHKDVKGQ